MGCISGLVDVNANYGAVDVLHRVTVEFSHGITALIGNNGSGKSTLLQLLATTKRPRSGSVFVEGMDLGQHRNVQLARSKLTYLNQQSGFPGRFTVNEAIEYSAWLHGIPRHQRRGAVEVASKLAGLTEVLTQRVGALSGGTRQRVFIAQAMVHRPKLVLLDEPTAGLDVGQRHHFHEALVALSEGSTVVVATHDLDEMRIADRIVALREGAIVADGSRDDLLPDGDFQNASTRVRAMLDGAS